MKKLCGHTFRLPGYPPSTFQKMIFFKKTNLQIFRYVSQVKIFQKFFGAHPAREAQNPGKNFQVCCFLL